MIEKTEKKKQDLSFWEIKQEWQNILKVKECISRNNHSGLMSSYNYDEPKNKTKKSTSQARW